MAIGARLLFIGDDGTGANLHGSELWTSDGTAAGTVMLKDINPGDSDSNITFQVLNPPMVVNGTLYFTANDGVHGVELWKSDGTAAGTMMVKDINPGSSTSFPSFFPQLTNINGTVYFEADDGAHGVELWKTDGTADGTVMVKDIDPGRGASNPFDLTNADGTLYFFANNGDTDGGGDPLWQLWKSDGTAAGTVMVKEFDFRRPTGLKAVNGGVEFFADNPRLGTDTLWFSDGTAAGTNELLDGFADPSFLALATNSAEVHSDILWQNANGQASIWEMNGNKLIGGGAVTPNPGTSWFAVGIGDFNGDAHSDILWQNTSWQVAIWDMNATKIIGGGAVSTNPGPSWYAIGLT